MIFPLYISAFLKASLWLFFHRQISQMTEIVKEECININSTSGNSTDFFIFIFYFFPFEKFQYIKLKIFLAW